MSTKSERPTPRNPHLLHRDHSAIVLVDVQPRLLAVIGGAERIVANIATLLRGAALLNVPVFATEQYPEKLGATVAELSATLQIPAVSKLRFSMVDCRSIVNQLETTQARQVVLVGIETHVCVLQSALDLLGGGFDVYVAVDAVGTRHATDHEIALQRMHGQGVTQITTEMALFEWCEVAGTEEFRKISAMVRERDTA